eukprot:2245873-Alexandrium_andersonii.AAC.1
MRRGARPTTQREGGPGDAHVARASSRRPSPMVSTRSAFENGVGVLSPADGGHAPTRAEAQCCYCPGLE